MKIEQAEKLAEVWEESESLKDAIHKAGWTGQDPRQHHRYRREAEQLLQIKLPSHNEAMSPQTMTECPSTLDLEGASKFDHYVITSCTNDSPLIKGFFDTLISFSEEHNAQLLVVPVNYMNTNIMTVGQDHMWDNRIYPYVVTEDFHINQNLVVSSARIRATAVNPLTGKNKNYQKKSVIYGHPQLAMQNVATPSYEMAKRISTTGSCNSSSYTATDAGFKAGENHTISALFIQTNGKIFYQTQLCYDGVGFQYYTEYWTTNGKAVSNSPLALHMGDSHAYWEDETISTSRKELINEVNPQALIYHDLHDHHSQSHHNNLREKIKIAQEGKWSVLEELQLSIKMLNDLGKNRMNYIISSNHNDHLEQWLYKFKPDYDPHNAPLYFKLMGLIADPSNEGKSAFQLAIEDQIEVDYKFIGRNDEFMVAGIDCSQHSDIGVNGTRSPLSFVQTGRKMNIGHGHSSFINKLVWRTGASNMDMSYNKGYSSWDATDILIHNNGERSTVTYVKGEYKL